MSTDFAERFREKLTAGAHMFGMTGVLCSVDRLSTLAQLVLDHNDRAGLTRIVEPTEMAGKHFLDSLKLLDCREWGRASTAVDVGSGAGFPGLVLAMCLNGVKFTLIEANAKKAEFLRLAAGELGVEADVRHVRAEDYGQLGGEGREGFDVGLARAAAKLAVSCEYVLPLVKKGGSYLAQVGPEDGVRLRELLSGDDGDRGASAGLPWTELGGHLSALCQYDLPWGQGCRYLARFAKTRTTPANYPRRAGIPARRPLPGFAEVKDGPPG